MGSFVVDNSVVIAWLFEDESSPYAEGVMDDAQGNTLHVPRVWPLELGNALVVAERRGRITESQLARMLALIGDLPIQVTPTNEERELDEVLGLAREHALTTYDASYLDLAVTMGLPLATQDKSLRRAAVACGVEIFQP